MEKPSVTRTPDSGAHDRRVTGCRYCGSPDLNSIIDLGAQPLANAFTSRRGDLNDLEAIDRIDSALFPAAAGAFGHGEASLRYGHGGCLSWPRSGCPGTPHLVYQARTPEHQTHQVRT